MKKPTLRSREIQATNNYSSDAQDQLETSRLIENQKQIFEDTSNIRVGGVPTN